MCCVEWAHWIFKDKKTIFSTHLFSIRSYHNTASEEEVWKCLEGGLPENVVDIDNYHFNPFAFDDFLKAKYTIYMFMDLFGLHRFDQQSLIRFTLTIKKNYRRVPYHNWFVFYTRKSKNKKYERIVYIKKKFQDTWIFCCKHNVYRNQTKWGCFSANRSKITDW